MLNLGFKVGVEHKRLYKMLKTSVLVVGLCLTLSGWLGWLQLKRPNIGLWGGRGGSVRKLS